MTITWEHRHATWQDAVRNGAVLPPDLVWAPNAGVATYPQWQDAVSTCAFAHVPFATSEYCEYSVEMEVDVYDRVLRKAEREGCVGVASTKPRRFLNPFRNPGQRAFPLNLAPNLSNGFCTLLDLHRPLDHDTDDDGGIYEHPRMASKCTYVHRPDLTDIIMASRRPSSRKE